MTAWLNLDVLNVKRWNRNAIYSLRFLPYNRLVVSFIFVKIHLIIYSICNTTSPSWPRPSAFVGQSTCKLSTSETDSAPSHLLNIWPNFRNLSLPFIFYICPLLFLLYSWSPTQTKLNRIIKASSPLRVLANLGMAKPSQAARPRSIRHTDHSHAACTGKSFFICVHWLPNFI